MGRETRFHGIGRWVIHGMTAWRVHAGGCKFPLVVYCLSKNLSSGDTIVRTRKYAGGSFFFHYNFIVNISFVLCTWNVPALPIFYLYVDLMTKRLHKVKVILLSKLTHFFTTLKVHRSTTILQTLSSNT